MVSLYVDYSDSELLVLLKTGDQEAFAEIYDRYWSAIYAQVYKMVRNREETMDILQDIFSALWLRADSINVETKLSGYLYIAARNRVFNLIKQNKIRNDYLDAVATYMSEVATETLDQLDERDMAAAIEAEISLLPPKMRQVFELSRKQNLSHKEIAALLGISEQTVRKQVQNALRILKPRLQALGAGITILMCLR
ncbi:RNA polymerase sigma factor [Olivibacter sitiensis]|uniref:RNA polymerase sigma factor n=1 Tax=Olivibacter sitiensis TaxID=376470 RepID=UPI0004217A63|nr:RNA polymerase sigma-70 factor [Olivibacter sitiensis]